MNKEDLINALREVVNHGDTVPMYIRGGGGDYVDEATIDEIEDDDDYEFVEDATKEEQEYFVGWAETKGAHIVALRHENGYNEENFDYFFAIWE